MDRPVAVSPRGDLMRVAGEAFWARSLDTPGPFEKDSDLCSFKGKQQQTGLPRALREPSCPRFPNLKQ